MEESRERLPTSILQQLVHSLDSGDPSIRYAAGEAIASQQDIQPFAGATEHLKLDGDACASR